MSIFTKITAATALSVALVATTAVAQTSQPYQSSGSVNSERVLSQAEINDLVARAQQQGVSASASGADVRYVGGSNIASETVLCCENVVEQVETRTEVQESTDYIDHIAERQIIEPRVVTNIQPIERRRAVGRVEDITENTVYDEVVLPARVNRDTVPPVDVRTNEDVRYELREQRTETTYDAVGARELTQPIVRTTVVPVQRRITRNQNETQTLDTRYEQVVAPAQIGQINIPQTVETYSSPTTNETREEVFETTFDYVSERNIYQPRVTTQIQPIEDQVLNAIEENVTADTIYREEVLASQTIREPAPAVSEQVFQQVTEQTVFEVKDVYIDQINRTLVQPVIVTTIQPVTNQVLNSRTEVIERDTVYVENRLDLRVEADPIPETRVNYIPQETTDYRENRRTTYFDAVTRRNVTQPVVVTQIQPINVERPNLRTERVTLPTQYETVRASMVVMNVGDNCNCNTFN